MGKKRHYRSKGPDPLNGLIDLAGAITMGAMTRHMIKKDYEKGKGLESAKAATMVHGIGSFRRGSTGLMSLGGLAGVNSAIKYMEKKEKEKAMSHTGSESTRHNYERRSAYNGPSFNLKPYRPNNNRYAWRLNCEDGSAYGIFAEDFETRDEYNLALVKARYEMNQFPLNSHTEEQIQPQNEMENKQKDLNYIYKVSRLDNGANTYYLSDKIYSVGDVVRISEEKGEEKGVVLSFESFSSGNIPEDFKITDRILGLCK